MREEIKIERIERINKRQLEVFEKRSEEFKKLQLIKKELFRIGYIVVNKNIYRKLETGQRRISSYIKIKIVKLEAFRLKILKLII